MKLIATILLCLVACTEEPKPLPYCPDVGCPEVALCSRDGECVCIPPDEGPPGISCTFEAE